MKYMGDHPDRKSRVANEFTDKIFTAPINQVFIFDSQNMIIIISFAITILILLPLLSSNNNNFQQHLLYDHNLHLVITILLSVSSFP